MFFLNVPANYNFLKSLYFYIRNTFKNNIEITNLGVLLPSRYSSNELKRVFLENSNDESLILPIIKAIGDIDYDDLLVSSGLNGVDFDVFNPEIMNITSNVKYKLLLIREILKNQQNQNINMNKAINLASDLDSFLKEVEINDLSLDNLDNLVDEEYSIHWQKILDFIKVFGKKWQKFTQENNIISNNSYSLEVIKLYQKSLELKKPEHPIIVAGNFLSVKNTKDLVKTLAKYDNTYFIFKGLENTLNTEEFENLEECYSHFHYKNIVKDLNVNIKNVKNIEFEECKVVDDINVKVLNNAMLPSHLTYKWHNDTGVKVPDNINFVECKNNFEELNIISFYIVNFIKNNGMKNIAIISNKDYSREIEMFLKRWDLPINNNFGINFLDNELVKYIFLVLNTYQNDFKAEFLLALLKNNYTYFNYEKEELNRLTELFEKKVLNNSNSNIENIKSYKKNINKIDNEKDRNILLNFIENIESFFTDFETKVSFTFDEILNIHLKIIEKITTNKNNDEIPFFNKKNERIIEYIKEIIEQSDCFGEITLDDYTVLLLSLFSDRSYRENYTLYPAINIISAEESRLVNYDLVIIPNLNDGVFPVNTATDPYMSKSMRVKFGLPLKENEVGKYCYDFIQLLSQKEVLLTRAEKNENKITFKSRFLQKLEIYLESNNKKLNTANEIVDLYKLYINKGYNKKNDVYKIAPKPQPAEKLTSLSATNINTLRTNPYDIYVKKILQLYKFNVITKQSNAVLVGNIIHKIFEVYCEKYNIYKNNPDAMKKLIENVLDEYDDKTINELYFDKIKVIFEEFIRNDANSRIDGYSVLVEENKEYCFEEQNFTLTAKIDRIEKNEKNVRIIDYKTGTPISSGKVWNGENLQLPIEALILKRLDKNIVIEQLQYWMTKYKNGKIVDIIDKKEHTDVEELLKKTEELILKLIYMFNVDGRPYFATAKNIKTSDYTSLARTKEWE